MAKRKPKIPVDWRIKNLDTGKVILPQFPLADGIKVGIGGTLVEQDRFGFQDAITNWVKGKVRTITFEAMLFARTKDEGLDVQDLLDMFEELAVQNSDLGRPPICEFSYGTVLSETVLVESIDPSIVSTLDSGEPREVRLSFALKRYKPFSQRPLDPTKPTKESFLLVASQAEQSYEQIAKRYYGDPLLGDRLRKRHPESPFAPSVGQVVKVPSRGVILTEVVRPTSHVFDPDDEDVATAYAAILETRNARKLVLVQ